MSTKSSQASGLPPVVFVVEGVVADGGDGADSLRGWRHLACAFAGDGGDDVADDRQDAGEVKQVVLGQPFEPGFIVLGEFAADGGEEDAGEQRQEEVAHHQVGDQTHGGGAIFLPGAGIVDDGEGAALELDFYGGAAALGEVQSESLELDLADTVAGGAELQLVDLELPLADVIPEPAMASPKMTTPPLTTQPAPKT